MSRLIRSIFVVLVVAIVAAALVWLLRRPLTDVVVSRWLSAQGVPSRYRLAELSADRVVLQDVRLGPVAAPDLRAARVDVRLRWLSLGPQVAGVTLVHLVLRATWGPNGLSFGDLDRLLPAPGAPPAPLPDVDLRLIGGRGEVTTPAGTIAVVGDGAGRLRSGFTGRFVLERARLAAGGCKARIPGADIAVATGLSGLTVVGDGRLSDVGCGSTAVAAATWRGDVRLPPDLSRYTGRVAVRTGATSTRVLALAASNGSVTIAGATSGGTLAGRLAVSATGVRMPSASVGRLSADGPYRLDPATGDATAHLTVALANASAALSPSRLDQARARLRDTLANPLARQFVARIGAASRDFAATATIDTTRRRRIISAIVTNGFITAATGARLVQRGRAELTRDDTTFDGGFDLAGGGLPHAALTGAGGWRGGWPTGSASLAMAPWSAGGTVIAVPGLDAIATGDTVTLTGEIGISGSIGGGIAVERLRLPVSARLDRDGGLIIGEHCLPVIWGGLSVGRARLAAGRVIACPAAAPLLTARRGVLQGGTLIGPLSLSGSADGAPLVATTTPIRVDLRGARVTLAATAIAGQLGARRVEATVEGMYNLAEGRGDGRLRTARLDDDGLPVHIDDASANWRLAGTRLTLAAAGARIVDRTAPARFQPLRVAAVAASLADGKLSAKGEVRLATGNERLGTFDARNDFGSGTGTATLATGALVFGPALQPYQITESLRGIVANVRGPVVGDGHVKWTRDTLISSGTMHIDRLALATEALGPVDGIEGEITFDDLLALTTPPGQTLHLGRINPGVAVDDGVVVFRLLGPTAAAIDSIVWPYAGGRLVLAPVTIRDGDLRRDFLLTVEDMDAAQFLQRFDIKNLNVTGRFDGHLPLAFANSRGRITGGTLAAQAGGGLVQYVGEVGTAQVGAPARLAFDALLRLRYRDLSLDLDGDLDGELVTQVHFTGSNEAPATLAGRPVPIRATGLPFRFGITVRAPFRALLGTAASLSDVRPLLRAAPDPVQPK
ncbi:intermembrane phospholipid transport protein YdbH family protein [Sphingomonas bacterium]|uniref:intermembrane phospholipid transport protein YdbH family protein n=1 Tax=Sphingomonas bacterium TaxID=1895847 RepID=UPI0015770015|nr:YdbH domain-containing protein [Sphingomonas bacterium]